MEGYKMNFNQDFTSLSVLSNSGLRLFSINGQDKVDEIFSKEINNNDEEIRLVERLFNSSLVVLVTVKKPNCLKMLHFKKKQDICNCVYPSDILCVRMNRHCLVVCLAESIHIHDIRDMKILHSIENIAPNELGLCTLSLNSYLAFPICSTTGELRIFNANKLKSTLTIRAHDTALSALTFAPSGQLLATASERGTVIRVFNMNGQRVQEFRRGIKRFVRIASLIFSANADFLCASSNTETVHVFKVDEKAVMASKTKSKSNDVTENATQQILTSTSNNSSSSSSSKNSNNSNNSSSSSSKTSATGNTDKNIVKMKIDDNAMPTAEIFPTTINTNNNINISHNSNRNNSNNNNNNSNSSNSGSGGVVSGWSGYLSKAVSSYLIPTQVSDVLAQDRAIATAVLQQPGLKHVCGLVTLQNELKLVIACEDGFFYIYDLNVERGGTCKLQRVHDLRYALEGVIELNLTDSIEKMSLPCTSSAAAATAMMNNAADAIVTSPQRKETSTTVAPMTSLKTCAASVLIENPDPTPDNSYAGILKGDQAANALTDSAKFRKLCDAIDTPIKLYDERQFPPVAIAAKD